MRFEVRLLVFGLALLVAPSLRLLQAQSQATGDAAATAADAAYTAHSWAAAESAYTALTKQDPENARFWYRLGVSERGNQHYESALPSFEKARTLGATKGLPGFIVDYELATTYAAMGKASEALAKLKASADAGFSQPGRLENESEWATLRADERFLALVKKVKHNATPCEDAEFGEFDFWVGDWEVTTTAGGLPAGSSHISKEMGGCVIWENWTSAGSPYFGKSYNTYNTNLHRWEQYWVDNSAGTIFFYGTYKDGIMDYWTDEVPQPNGQKLRRHLQFFNQSADQVRQFSQGSTDGGKTWNVEYDFTYTRRRSNASSVQ